MGNKPREHRSSKCFIQSFTGGKWYCKENRSSHQNMTAERNSWVFTNQGVLRRNLKEKGKCILNIGEAWMKKQIWKWEKAGIEKASRYSDQRQADLVLKFLKRKSPLIRPSILAALPMMGLQKHIITHRFPAASLECSQENKPCSSMLTICITNWMSKAQSKWMGHKMLRRWMLPSVQVQ